MIDAGLSHTHSHTHSPPLFRSFAILNYRSTMPPKATRTKNTGNNTRQSRGARSTMSKTNAGHNTNQPKITDLGAATSKKGAVRKARREGGIGSKMDLDKKPTEAATAPSSSPRVVGSKPSFVTQEEA